MSFKLSNYNKIYFFDFDDNIISLLDANIYYYEIVNNEIKQRQVNTRNFAKFFEENYSQWRLEIINTYDDLLKKKNNWTISNYQFYIVNEVSYKNFREDQLFLKQVDKTCNLSPNDFINRLNLSFPAFLETFFNTENLFYIVTARGQDNTVIYEWIKRIIKKFIEVVITQYNWVYKFNNNKVFNVNEFIIYLNSKWSGLWLSVNNPNDLMNKIDNIIDHFVIVDNIIPATNPKTLKRFWINQNVKPEKGKIIKTLLSDILINNEEKNWLIWFSDDMAENIEKVEKDVKNYLKNISKDYDKNISLYLFYIWKKEEDIKIYHF